MLNMEMVAAAAVRNPLRLLMNWSLHGRLWRSTEGVAHLSDMNDDRPRLWTPSELADYTGIPVRTLADWRTARASSRGLGLPFVALSSHNVRCRNDDVEALIAARVIAPEDRTGD